MIIKLTDAFDGQVYKIESGDIRAMFSASNSTTVIMFNDGMLITVLETSDEIENAVKADEIK